MYTINWKVDDGYINNGPHATQVSLEDFEEDMDIDHIKEELIDIVQEDFENTVQWESGDFDDVAEQIYEALQERGGD